MVMPNIYSTETAGETLGLTSDRVSRIAKDGLLPGAVLVGGRWIIPQSAIDHYKTHRKKPGRPVTTGAGLRRKDRRGDKVPPNKLEKFLVIFKKHGFNASIKALSLSPRHRIVAFRFVAQVIMEVSPVLYDDFEDSAVNNINTCLDDLSKAFTGTASIDAALASGMICKKLYIANASITTSKIFLAASQVSSAVHILSLPSAEHWEKINASDDLYSALECSFRGSGNYRKAKFIYRKKLLSILAKGDIE